MQKSDICKKSYGKMSLKAPLFTFKEQLAFVKQEVRSLAIHMEERKFISANDKTLITGLNHNNRPKLAPEYQPESPYAYPLFKIHKLSNSDIQNKKIPPNRLVHASKFASANLKWS